MYVQDATVLLLNNQVSKLRELLLGKHPGLGTLLSEIKKALEQHPENVTLLKEEDMGTIFDALKVETGVIFAAETIKGTKGSGLKSLKDKINKMGQDAF